MKQIDLGKSSDLERLKNEVVSIFEGKIESAKINESTKSFSSLPMQTLMNIFKHTSGYLFESKDGTKIIARYIKTLKENESLRKAFSFCENMSSRGYVKNVDGYILENVGLLSSLNKKQFKEGKEKLAKILKEAVKIAGLTSNEIDSIISENKKLNESIEFIIENKKTAKNLREYVNRLSFLSENIANNMESEEELSEEEGEQTDDTLSNITESNAFNTAGLEPWEASVVRDIVLSDLSRNNAETLFETYKKRCMDKMDGILSENASVETVSRINGMREKLQEKVYSKETEGEDLLMLSKLEYMLQ